MELIETDVGDVSIQPEHILACGMPVGHFETAAAVLRLIDVLHFVGELFAILERRIRGVGAADITRFRNKGDDRRARNDSGAVRHLGRGRARP